MVLIIKQLGLDFGSSATTVVGFAEGIPDPIVFTPRDKTCFFSALAKRTDADEYVFFDKAFENLPGYKFHGEFKENITTESTFVYRYLKEVFTEVRDMKSNDGSERSSQVRGASDFDFSQLETVCYGYPEYADNENKIDYCNKMNEILPTVLKEVFGKNDIKIISHGEPQLASLAYYCERRKKSDMNFNADDTMLVLDFGGHTLDIALVKIAREGMLKPIKCKSSQIMRSLGTGKTINSLISLQVEALPYDKGIEDAKRHLFNNKPNSGSERLFPLKYSRYDEDLEKYVDRSVLLTYNERGKYIFVSEIVDGVTTMDGKANISIVYNEACIFIEQFLKGAGICPHSIKHLLFTGGTTRIQYLREEILNTIGEWLRSDCNVIQTDQFGGNSDFVFYDPLTLLYTLPYISFTGLPDKEYKISSENVVALGAALYALDPELLEAGDNSGGNRPIDTPPPPSNLSEIEVLVKRLYYDYKSCIKDNYKNGFCDACKDLLDLIDLSKP